MTANNFMVFKFKFYDLLIRVYCLCAADQLSNIHFRNAWLKVSLPLSCFSELPTRVVQHFQEAKASSREILHTQIVLRLVRIIARNEMAKSK